MMFDIVIVDAGNSFQHRELTAFTDVVVALVSYEREHWAGTRLVDRRPDRVQFPGWLDSMLDRFKRAGGRPMDPLEKLLAFLDEATRGPAGTTMYGRKQQPRTGAARTVISRNCGSASTSTPPSTRSSPRPPRRRRSGSGA
ncbi:hypothetical protein OIE62_41165 (plasmid) [Streptomyces scopuliridis]|uniref:Uncharacterized protein n=1 Tax=Streptomyces scopuliridis TaxID=452529 RepID=A0ACD4ZYF4_9ACTN|nr:hypothetical protein [Streptomyces scopuliridis]WSC03525.1 hypothetical protein OG835_42330 [Streptomyces scopuliridis]WSC11331.1 hypothetical protein OIE62_41165 [Streptomyces scopuliridis]